MKTDTLAAGCGLSVVCCTLCVVRLRLSLSFCLRIFSFLLFFLSSLYVCVFSFSSRSSSPTIELHYDHRPRSSPYKTFTVGGRRRRRIPAGSSTTPGPLSVVTVDYRFPLRSAVCGVVLMHSRNVVRSVCLCFSPLATSCLISSIQEHSFPAGEQWLRSGFCFGRS